MSAGLSDWLTAAGTVGALLIALSLVGKQKTAFVDAQEDRRREGAKGISATTDRYPDDLVVKVRNAATSPVFNCNVEVDAYKGGVAIGSISVELGTIHAGDPDGKIEKVPIPNNLKDADRWLPRITFADSGGEAWARSPEGQLTALSKLTPPKGGMTLSLSKLSNLLIAAALLLAAGIVGAGITETVEGGTPAKHELLVIDGNGLLLCGLAELRGDVITAISGTPIKLPVRPVAEVATCQRVNAIVVDRNGVALCGPLQAESSGVVDLRGQKLLPPISEVTVVDSCP